MISGLLVRLESSREGDLLSKLKDETHQAAPDRISVLDNVLQLIGLLILLAVILAGTYYVTRFVGRLNQGQLKKSNFEVIDACRLSRSSYLQIIKIADEYYVIAVGRDSVSFITKLEADKVIKREADAEPKTSFKQILEKFKSNKK
jgi:flagellar protein FliO/FliZ